jgi:hypothetical protein
MHVLVVQATKDGMDVVMFFAASVQEEKGNKAAKAKHHRSVQGQLTHVQNKHLCLKYTPFAGKGGVITGCIEIPDRKHEDFLEIGTSNLKHMWHYWNEQLRTPQNLVRTHSKSFSRIVQIFFCKHTDIGMIFQSSMLPFVVLQLYHLNTLHRRKVSI